MSGWQYYSWLHLAALNVDLLRNSINCLRCPEFSIGGSGDGPVILDVQLEFLSSAISSEIKDLDVIFASEGHVAFSADLQAALEGLNSKPDNVLFKTKFVSQQVWNQWKQCLTFNSMYLAFDIFFPNQLLFSSYSDLIGRRQQVVHRWCSPGSTHSSHSDSGNMWHPWMKGLRYHRMSQGVSQGKGCWTKHVTFFV